MNNLKTLLKEYKETKALAEINLENTDPRFRPSREMLKTDAINKIDTFKSNLGKEFSKAAFSIFPSGPCQEEFAKLAADQGAIVVDANEMYAKLGQRCWETMGVSRSFSATQYSTLISELRMLAAELKIDFNLPTFVSSEYAPELDNVINTVKTLVETANQKNIVKVYIENQVYQKAIEEEIDGKVLPVVLLNVVPSEMQKLTVALFSGNGVRGMSVETTSENVNEELITTTFKQISKLIKENKQ